MNAINRLFDRFTYGLHMLSGVILIAMMFITLTDVLTRTLFKITDGKTDLTFIGGIELIKYGLLIMVLLSLPYSVRRSQVIVDLLTEKLPERGKAFLEGLFMLGFVALGYGMSTRFLHAIEQVKMTGETTQDLLIPLSYFYGISAFATAVLAVASLLVSIRCWFFWKEDTIS